MPFSFGEVLHLDVFEVPMPTTQYAVPVPPAGTTFPQASNTCLRIHLVMYERNMSTISKIV